MRVDLHYALWNALKSYGNAFYHERILTEKNWGRECRRAYVGRLTFVNRSLEV
jgi:hypothetical protein